MTVYGILECVYVPSTNSEFRSTNRTMFSNLENAQSKLQGLFETAKNNPNFESIKYQDSEGFKVVHNEDGKIVIIDCMITRFNLV